MSTFSGDSLDFAICGVKLRFHCGSELVKRILVRKYWRFMTSHDQPDLSVVVTVRKRYRRPGVGTIGEIVVERGKDRLLLRRADFEAELVRDGASGALGRGRVSSVPSEYSLDAFLRSALQTILVEEGKVFVHAAALRGSRNKRACAFLFPGRSGMGKSTLARKFGDEAALTDELPCLAIPRGLLSRHGKTRWEQQEVSGEAGFHAVRVGDLRTCGSLRPRIHVSVFGTPFHGRFSSPGHNLRLPLAGIFFLERGFGPRALQLRRSESLVRLMELIACYEKYETVAEVMLRIGHAVTATVPCFVFGFDMSESPAAIIARLNSALNQVMRREGR